MRHMLMAGLAGFVLAACSGADTPVETAETTAAPAEAVVEEVAEAVDPLAAAVNGAWRSAEHKARDAFRHPAETLAFFEVGPSETVIEIAPGGGWYTQILAPYLAAGGGTYIAANSGNAEGDARFLEAFSDEALYGAVSVTTLNAESGALAEPGTIDTVLTFRNVHNWMGRGFEAKVFADAYAALKPGGVLGVVEHRLPSAAEQHPQAITGYVHEDYVIGLAEAAGFTLGGRSEVNANPADTADHPFGVWTLPPVSATEDREGNAPEDFDPAKYAAIGESDRFTLKFVKPAE